MNWFLCEINARNLSWAGVEQGGHPEWVRSLWGVRFTETRICISYNGFDATQIDSYPTMRKTASPSATIWTLFEETN